MTVVTVTCGSDRDLFGWVAGWLVCSFVGWLVRWLVGSLIDWLV